MMTLKPLQLYSSRSHKDGTYDKATYIVFSTPSPFTMKFPFQKHSAKGVFQIRSPISGVNFSINISLSQVRVNIKEIENGKTFEIS